MKKGIEWLDLMTRKEQVIVLKNLSEFPLTSVTKEPSISNYLNCEFSSFFDFLDKSFDWGATKEGYDYWEEFAYSRK
jgi:hypothetical protein